MGKTKYIQNRKTGRFDGSIGSGKSDIPTLTPNGAPQPDHVSTHTDSSVANAWTSWNKKQSEPKISEVTIAAPDEIKNRLKAIDNFGLNASNIMMDLREKKVYASSSLTIEGRENAERYEAAHTKVHAAVIQARAEIRAAAAAFRGDTTFEAGATPVLDADLLSWEAAELADTIEDADITDPETKGRYLRANRHIIEARRIIETALQN